MALTREELGLRIRTAREALGLSQQEMALKIGLKHGTDISRYERGKIEVPRHRINLIAELTGRPRSYFMRDPGEAEELDERLERVEDRLSEVLDRLEAMRVQLAALGRPAEP